GSAIGTPYDVPNQRVEAHGSDSPLRQGSYRALASTANVFARESHMDDVAHALKLDPLAFRLKNLPEGRLRAVLEAAAKGFGCGRILNPRFSAYRVPRFADVPQMEVILLDRKDLASAGAGETPIVAIAPAVGNAIFNATGVRLRSLPMVPNGLKVT